MKLRVKKSGMTREGCGERVESGSSSAVERGQCGAGGRSQGECVLIVLKAEVGECR